MKHLCNLIKVKETSSGTVEICTECKEKIYFNKNTNGDVDNTVYLKEHKRDFLQPNGITGREFKKYYGSKTEKEKP